MAVPVSVDAAEAPSSKPNIIVVVADDLGAPLGSGPEKFGFDHFFGLRVGGMTPLTHKWLGLGRTRHCTKAIESWSNERAVMNSVTSVTTRVKPGTVRQKTPA
jgi:hypothetical protein